MIPNHFLTFMDMTSILLAAIRMTTLEDDVPIWEMAKVCIKELTLLGLQVGKSIRILQPNITSFPDFFTLCGCMTECK